MSEMKTARSSCQTEVKKHITTRLTVSETRFHQEALYMR